MSLASFLVNIGGSLPVRMALNRLTPTSRALQERAAAGGVLRDRLVHTGQHYDPKLSGAFFEQLGIRSGDWSMPEQINRRLAEGNRARALGWAHWGSASLRHWKRC